MRHGTTVCGLLLAAVMAGGCAQPVPPPPRTVAEYDHFVRSGAGGYPRQTILLHNLQRVLDKEIATDARIESLRVIDKVGGEEPIVLDQLAVVLGDSGNPPQLHAAVLDFLLKKDYPELAGYVMRVLPISSSGQIRQALMDWLVRHPTPAVLSGVVRVWSDQLSLNRTDSAYYQQAVERITNRSWDAALLEALNTPGFTAPGAAMGILARHMAPGALSGRISASVARSEAMTTAQWFIAHLDYLPDSEAELASAVAIYRTRQNLLGDVAGLSGKWRAKYGYRFNIRDVHLLAGLSRDSNKAETDRATLVGALSEVLLKRRHIRYGPARTAREDVTIRFDRLADRLTMADLWNLRLLNEMLSRPPVQAALRVMSLQDRADRKNAWGGQVFLENGQAAAKLYPADVQAADNDSRYVPSARSASDGRDALCRFSAHFEQPENAPRSGPDTEELADARENNYYGLILTAVSESTFCAHYYNPQGIIVSLGEFPMGN